MMDVSHNGTEATPEPEGPPRSPTRDDTSPFWEDDGSLPSLPPVPSPMSALEYSASSPLGAVVMTDAEDTSLFSDKSLEDRLHRTLNRHVDRTTPRPAPVLEPTFEVARLVQQVEILRETNSELRNENKMLIAGGRSLEAQKDQWMEARMTADLQKGEALQECASLRQELERAREEADAKEKVIAELRDQIEILGKEHTSQSAEQLSAAERRNEELKHEMERLRNENESLENQRTEQLSAAERRNEEAKREIERLQEQNASLELARNELAEKLGETRALLAEANVDKEERMSSKPCTDAGVQTESTNMRTASSQTLSIETSDCITRTEQASGAAKRDALTDRVGNRMDAFVAEAVHRITDREDEHSHFNSTPIGERLCRIRDAAERASLLKDHQREVSRLMAEHESEKKQLKSSFEKEKHRLLEEAMAEMNAGYNGLQKRLESELDKKMEECERKQRKEIKHIKEEAEHAVATAAESAEAALGQVASVNQRYERERKKRESLEVRLDQLQKGFITEKKAMADKHAKDLERLGDGWEEERSNLVDMLQRECNVVFDRSKRTGSPRSVSTEFFVDVNFAEKQHVLSPHETRNRPIPEVVSPSFSELDRTLRETEALVEMVLNRNSRQ